MGQEIMPWVQILIVGLLICVVFVSVAIFLILPNFGIDFVRQWLQGGGGTSAPEAIVLQNAIQCAYNRCVYGCNSNQVKNLKYSVSGNFFDCTQFCKPEWTDTGTIDGNICDDNAKAHPVTARVGSDSGEKISMDKLSFAVCILQSDACTSTTSYNYFSNVVYVDKNIALANSGKVTTCPIKLPQVGGILGYSSIVINQGTYNIWTSSHTQVSGGQAILVCSS